MMAFLLNEGAPTAVGLRWVGVGMRCLVVVS